MTVWRPLSLSLEAGIWVIDPRAGADGQRYTLTGIVAAARLQSGRMPRAGVACLGGVVFDVMSNQCLFQSYFSAASFSSRNGITRIRQECSLAAGLPLGLGLMATAFADHMAAG